MRIGCYLFPNNQALTHTVIVTKQLRCDLQVRKFLQYSPWFLIYAIKSSICPAIKQSVGLLSRQGILKACNFWWKMTYGTNLPSILMIASLSLVRMNISTFGVLSWACLHFLLILQSSEEWSSGGVVHRFLLLVNRLIAALMALYSQCVLSLALPVEVCSFSGPSACGSAELNPQPNQSYKCQSWWW